ncbi:hypothetical protein AKJ16_DCAP22775 [Drosera capensis]
MGEHEDWVRPSVMPNGLLPGVSGSVIRDIDGDRWLNAEKKTADLIACIQPNQPSEERRNAVADYVQRLIRKCFPCEVCTFGSVPLKTYLPDGDIDVTTLCENQTLKETWASQVRDMLESEEKNENAEFHVKEVQYIQAEVKIIKCLVENIVVDISFNQIGGLCTLCFLEEVYFHPDSALYGISHFYAKTKTKCLLQVDGLINQNHLFKRSIILIKAWCYYESRILGAHHGLISTYALETLVLYIFHVFNNTFAGPLEVLYRFLEFFSNFDWDNFCLSLWGPVPISSLPDVTAEPPRKDGGELNLSQYLVNLCRIQYTVSLDGQENQGQGTPFISKHFNVIDPLRVNNNLGRSVSKGNFFRIRSAFAFGAKRLARLLDCPEEDIGSELNQFFMNTWDRHGSGNRPDVPSISPSHGPSNVDHLQGSNVLGNTSNSKKMNGTSSAKEVVSDGSSSLWDPPPQRARQSQESTSKMGDGAASSAVQTWVSKQAEKGKSNQGAPLDRDQRSSKFDQGVNHLQGKYLFARTRSSPELTDTYNETSSRGRLSKPAESGKTQATSTRTENNRRKNLVSEIPGQGETVDASLGSNSSPSSYTDGAEVNTMIKENVRADPEAMHQEEQDRVNMMAASLQTLGGQVSVPMNFANMQVPMAISPSLMASLGYPQRSMAGMAPANFPLISPSWASNMQFPHGMIQSPLGAPYFTGIRLSSNSEDVVERENEDLGSAEMAFAEADGDFWPEQDRRANGAFSPDKNMEMLSSEDQQPSTSGSRLRAQQKLTKNRRDLMREENPESYQHSSRIMDNYLDDSRNLAGYARSSSASQAGSMRSRGSSESSWDGSSAKASKTTREKRGRKSAASPSSSSIHGKGVRISDRGAFEADDDNGDWSPVSTGGAETAGSLHVSRHHINAFEATETSGSDSSRPIAPILLGPGSRQMDNNSGSVPLTFYPAGPPVPFLTMLPVYNFPRGSSNSDKSRTHGHVIEEDGQDNDHSYQIYGSDEVHVDPETLSTPSRLMRSSVAEPSREPQPDILNSDFHSHWQNLQYGRFCQNTRFHGQVVYQSPVVMPPPMYLQGRVPWDGPGRPFTTTNNMNVLSQVMSYGPRVVPVAPVTSVPNRPSSVYQRYADELPRYRSGTGTYLPNPKASARERHSSGTRRNNYNYDRNEHYVDREGSWTSNPKSRAAGHSHNRSQTDKSSSRVDRLAPNESRSDRPWGSSRNEAVPAYRAQNDPLRPNSSQAASTNVAYGMYQLPGMNQSGVTSNGPAVPSVVMLYPYEQNPSYGATTREQLEFGSLGRVGFMAPGMNEAAQRVQGTRIRGAFEEPRFHGDRVHLASPEQPSSPHLPR